MIDLTLLVKAGSVDLPAGQAGLARLLNGTLIRGGTGRFSPEALARYMDEHALRIKFSAGDESTSIHLSVLKEDWERGIELLQELLTRPRFDPRIVDIVRTNILTGLRRQGGNARNVAMREAQILRFPGHPYSRDPLEALNTLPVLGPEDMRQFLQERVVPKNLVVAVSGDIQKHDALEGVKRLLDALSDSTPPVRRLKDPEPGPPALAFIHKPGQMQTQVVLGLPGVKRTNPDYWKINLLMDVFGGRDSLLYKRLRDDLGLVYSAWFYQTYKWKAGFLIGFIGCKADKTGNAIRETAQIMKTLHRGIPAPDLKQKRLDALNGFVFNVDTPEALAKTYATYALRGEPLDTLERIQDAFISASRDELTFLAGKLLRPEALQIVVVGDGKLKIKQGDGSEKTLEQTLEQTARELNLPYREIPLR
jgi:zinc protease